MRVSTKGQVTIPQHIRDELGLLPHTEVVFEIDGDSARIRKASPERRERGRRLIERLRGRATSTLSTDEIMALTRAEP